MDFGGYLGTVYTVQFTQRVAAASTGNKLSAGLQTPHSEQAETRSP